ncbi:MAG TPA: LysM peptidoglycan-binding domain-containing protein, partial [Anaerolineales bacterium]|nr:LysM peptidoglycan-binding domain-containing protein [Anaerolineales bacterium]
AGLAHSLRWEAWRSVLEAGLQAAQTLGDLPAKALMLHQLGTRALCLNEIKPARGYLVRALSLRRMLGDRAGAAVTLHNLRLIIGPSGSNGNEPPDLPDIPGPPSNPWLPLAAVLKGATAAMLAAVLVAWIALGVYAYMVARQTPTPPMMAHAPAITASATPNSPTPRPDLPTWTATLPAPTATHQEITPVEEPTTTPTHTPTDAPVAKNTHTNDPLPCQHNELWPVYTISRGDTLWSIAQATGTTVRELKAANCLERDIINTGKGLHVPRLPLPDLVITEFSLENDSPVYNGWNVLVPFDLVITNQGKVAAEPFEVALYYQPGLEGGQVSPLTLATNTALKPGKSVELQGQLDFRRPAESADLELWAVADECANRPGEGCKIAESNEQNNTSGIVEVRLEGDRPPTVQLNEPNASILQGFSGNIEGGWYREVTLSGNAEDPEDGILEGSAITWRTDRSDLQDGVLGEGAHLEGIRLYVDRCSGTEHTLTMTATDSLNQPTTASRTVTIQGKSCRPRLSLTSPEAGTWSPSGYEKENQRFYLSLDGVVSATDVFGRPIDEASIIWATDQVNIQEAILGRGPQVNLVLYAPDTGESYVEFVHTVTVTVTDREGNQAQESFSITIYISYESEQ